MHASGEVYESQSVGDAVSCCASSRSNRPRSAVDADTHQRGRRPRSASSQTMPTGMQPGARLVQTRSGWRATPFKDYRSAFEIQRQAKLNDAQARRWAQGRDRQQHIRPRSLSRPIERVSPADYAKLPGKAAQSRMIKQQLRQSDQIRQAQNVSSAYVLRSDSSGAVSEPVSLQKGDEVAVEIEGVITTGIVRACFQPRAPSISSGRPQSPPGGAAEVLVRFDVGGGWFSRDEVLFKSRPAQPVETNLLQRILRDDPHVKAQIMSLRRQNGVSGNITDLVAGMSSGALRRSASGTPQAVKEGESGLLDSTKRMFRLVMDEDVEELQRLLDEGADITVRNALGQSMYEVASEKRKAKSIAWLDSVASAAQRYLQDNCDTLSAAMHEKVTAVIEVASPQMRTTGQVIMAAGRLGRGLRARKLGNT